MREVVTLQLGKGGLNVGNQFWDYIRTEHGLDPMGVFHGNSNLQLEYIDVFFQNVDWKRHYPRTVLVASDERMISNVLKDWRMYNPEMQMLVTGTNNVYSRGKHYFRGEVLSTVMEKYRYLAEQCDTMQAVQIIHSMGGGTGSALTGQVLEQLKDINGNKIMNVLWSILPSLHVSDSPTTTYNTILTLPTILADSHATFCIDNQALHRIGQNILKSKIEISMLNYLVALAMSGTSASARFPGQQNSDWRKMIVNLVPDPNMHLLLLSFAPLHQRFSMKPVTVSSMVNDIFNPSNYLTSVDTSRGRYLASTLFIRGRVRMFDVDNSTAKKNLNIEKSKYIPDSIMRSVCDIPPPGMSMSATLAANNTAVAYLFDRILFNYQAMLKKRAFMHWYDAMEEIEFHQRAKTVDDVLQRYKSIGKLDLTNTDTFNAHDDNDW